jgi:hypothetical protein
MGTLVNLIEPKSSDWEYYHVNGPVPSNWQTKTGGWTVGPAPFGNYYGTWGGRDDFVTRTFWPADGWDGDDLLVRKVIDLTNIDLSKPIHWFMGTDNGMTLYVNGIKVTSRNDEGYAYKWEYSGRLDPALYNLVNGPNIIAVALEDHGGLTAFDMMITGESTPPTPITNSEVAIRAYKNSVIIQYTAPISIVGGVFNTSAMDIYVDGARRKIQSATIDSEFPNELKLTLEGRDIDKAKQVSLQYNEPASVEAGNLPRGYISTSSGSTLINIPGLNLVQTLFSDSSISNLGLASAFSTLVLQGVNPISGIGNSLNNVIYGNTADNIIDGREGLDFMAGGNGNDVYIVDDAGDRVIEEASRGNDTVISRISYTLPDHVENLDLDGSFHGYVNRNSSLQAANINGTGNNLNNKITGNSSKNILDGKGGSDTLIGGKGDDIYIVDSSSDVISELGGTGDIDSVQSSVSWTLGGNLEHLTLTDNASFGIGNNLDNIITGNSNNNRLDGISGRDTLIGGAGNDTFVLGSVLTRNKFTTITDFTAGSDKVELTRARFRLPTSILNSFKQVDNVLDFNYYAESSTPFVYNRGTGELFYNQNGTGRGWGSGGLIALFENKPNLAFSDITLI